MKSCLPNSNPLGNPLRPKPICGEDVVEVIEENKEIEDKKFEERDLQQEGGEAEVPRCVRDPGEPTAKERQEHDKSHLPYRSWCKFCVMGRGRDLPHKARERRDDGVPIIAMDFFFLGEPDVEKTMPAVVIRDSISKALFAHVIPGKGLDYDWTANQVVADIGRLGYPKVIIRSDQEPAITALVVKVKEIRDSQHKETMIEWSPKCDSNANGQA